MKEWKCKDCCCFETDACPYPYVQEHYNSCAQVVIQHDEAYQQGRADKDKELSELPNQYSEKLWKNAHDRGYEQGRVDAIDEFVKAFKDNMQKSKTTTWTSYVEEIAEQLKEKK